MKQLVEKAKASPIAATILALTLGGGTTTVATNYDYLVSVISIPQRIARVEQYIKADIRQKIESGEMTIEEALDIMFPKDSSDGG